MDGSRRNGRRSCDAGAIDSVLPFDPRLREARSTFGETPRAARDFAPGSFVHGDSVIANSLQPARARHAQVKELHR